MSSYLRNEIVLIRYPFSDLSGAKVRPAVIVSPIHPSMDVLITPLTSRTSSLQPGEFVMQDWAQAGLLVPTAVKRGVYTIQRGLILKRVGEFSAGDAAALNDALSYWLGL